MVATVELKNPNFPVAGQLIVDPAAYFPCQLVVAARSTAESGGPTGEATARLARHSEKNLKRRRGLTVQARMEYQDRASKAFNLLYEYEEFIANDAIHADEIKGDGAIGIYTVQAAISRSDVGSLEAKLEGARNSFAEYKAIYEQFDPSVIADTTDAEKLLSFANSNTDQMVWPYNTPAPANTFLTNSVRQKQSYTQTLSFKKRFGENFLQASRPWQFTVDDSLFPNQCQTRLKGINAFVVTGSGATDSFAGTNTNSFSAFFVQVPNTQADSFYKLSDATKVVVDQRAVPPIRIGRILTRAALPYQEIYGANVLRNVSPMGTWTVTLKHTGLIADISDIVLDLELVGRFKA